jgi:hypothetical protein
VVLAYDLPLGNLLLQVGELLAFQCRHSAAARNTRLAG